MIIIHDCNIGDIWTMHYVNPSCVMAICNRVLLRVREVESLKKAHRFVD